MTSYLIDVNVWIAMTWQGHPQNATTVRWLSSIRNAECLFCRFTMLAFLRILTNRSVMGGSVVTLAEALDFYDRWLGDPRVEFVLEPHGVDTIFRGILPSFAKFSATKAITDCYLLALAEAAGAHLVTLDTALASHARLRRTPATLISPAVRDSH